MVSRQPPAPVWCRLNALAVRISLDTGSKVRSESLNKNAVRTVRSGRRFRFSVAEGRGRGYGKRYFS